MNTVETRARAVLSSFFPSSTVGELVREQVKQVLSAYACVFFSTNPLVGLIFLAATLVLPTQGVSGLGGLLMANGFAFLLGIPKEQIRSGYFAFNGLLQGLALGLTYEVNGPFLVMLIAISFVGVVIASGMRHFFVNILGVPALSLPFVITTWIMVAAGNGFDNLTYTLKPFEITALIGWFPLPLEFLARSVGAAFFQLSVPAGLLILTGLLISSRHAFLLACIGLTTGTGLHLALGGQLHTLSTMWLGFNFVLTAIAVGGIFVVPSRSSLILAAASAAACALLSSGFIRILEPMELPILAFPFLCTTIVILYALRTRPNPQDLKPVLIPAGSPEKNLKTAKDDRIRFVTGELLLYHLPVFGEWTVTQGFNGDITHRENWSHAWDLEITDDFGNTFRNLGTSVNDYYCYNKPVFAAADGKVVKVVNYISDNPIGQINQSENWGNLVIIWHPGNVFSTVCHLLQNSVLVKEGEAVYRGQPLARVGNSGRSPIPHLHFQAQSGPAIGAPTLPCEFIHYTTNTELGLQYRSHGIPRKGERICPMEHATDRFADVSFPIGGQWNFAISQNGSTHTEKWESMVDFSGRRYLQSSIQNARLYFYIDHQILILLGYTGPRNTGLHWLFTALPRLPVTKSTVYWKDKLPTETRLSGAAQVVFDLFEPIGELATVQTCSSFCQNQIHGFGVKTELTMSGPLMPPNSPKLTLITRFQQGRGLTSMTVTQEEGTTIMELHQIETSETHTERYTRTIAYAGDGEC